MSEAIIVFNAGSTSVKFAAYAVGGPGPLTPISHGEVSDMQTDPQFIAKNAAGKPLDAHEFGKGHEIDHRTALHFVVTWLEKNIASMKVVAAGHRVVLGGARFEAPVLIDADVLAYLNSLVVMEPSHQPYNVRGARALAEAFPGLPQVACFDTSFHRTMPEVAQIYALPKDVLDAGARHWGYHGISYDYISRQLPKYAPGARRVIAAHLGGGASLCAMLDGKSVETTMGFGALTGLPMATRSGDVPQDLLFYLLRRKLFDDASLEKMLYERAGPARSVRRQRRHAGLAGERGSAGGRGDRVFRLRDGEVRRRLRGCARRARRLCLHRRHRRELGPRARGAMQHDGVARREAGRADERFGRTAHFHLGQRRVGLGHPHQRRTDDCAAHACARSPLGVGRN